MKAEGHLAGAVAQGALGPLLWGPQILQHSGKLEEAWQEVSQPPPPNLSQKHLGLWEGRDSFWNMSQ